MRYGARRSWTDTRDVERSAICACGWGGVFPGIKEAMSAFEAHAETGTEGCDHAVNIEDHQPEHQHVACPANQETK